MSLIERDPARELLTPLGVEQVPVLPDVACDDRRPMWQIMGYVSLEDMDQAFFSDEVVDEVIRAQRQRTESARAVDLRRARRRIGLEDPLEREGLVGMAALQAGIEAGRIYLF